MCGEYINLSIDIHADTTIKYSSHTRASPWICGTASENKFGYINRF